MIVVSISLYLLVRCKFLKGEKHLTIIFTVLLHGCFSVHLSWSLCAHWVSIFLFYGSLLSYLHDNRREFCIHNFVLFFLKETPASYQTFTFQVPKYVDSFLSRKYEIGKVPWRVGRFWEVWSVHELQRNGTGWVVL